MRRDCLSPQFCWDARQVAFVAGRNIYEWKLASGALRIVYEAPQGVFPRMGGWPRSMPGPVFWEGRDYARLPRDDEGRFVFPEDSPVASAATDLRAGSGPARRIKAMSGHEAVFYMAQPQGGTFGLRKWDGRCEERVSPAGRLVHLFDVSEDGLCWCWSSDSSGGPARLDSFGAGGDALRIELRAAPSLLGLAARSDGGALVSFRREGRASRELLVVDAKGIRWTSGGSGAWFRPTAGGQAVAAVYVREDTDDDGELTPLDQGELWVSWEGP